VLEIIIVNSMQAVGKSPKIITGKNILIKSKLILKNVIEIKIKSSINSFIKQAQNI